jgi:uncharacterized protein YndB with AHSA1/START domain
MTFSETTARAQTEKVSFQLDLPHPPQKVWRALTDPTLLAEWLLPVFGFELEAGAAFLFKAPAFPGWDGTVSCQLLEIEPLRKLSYKWSVPFLDTVVTFSLTRMASGTRLTLEQTGFKEDQRREFGGARYGWKKMGERLVELLDRIP